MKIYIYTNKVEEGIHYEMFPDSLFDKLSKLTEKYGIESINYQHAVDVTSDDVVAADKKLFDLSKAFNIAKFSMSIGFNHACADHCCPYGFDSIIDKTLYVVSITIARLFGDTNPEALNDIKNLLAERYAIDENWGAHSDYKWQEYQNCFLTVKAFWDAQYNLMREE